MATRFWVLDQMTYIVLIFSHPSTICTLVVEEKLKAWTHTRWFEKGGFYLLWHTLYNVMCVHNKKRRMEGVLGMCKSTLVKFFFRQFFFYQNVVESFIFSSCCILSSIKNDPYHNLIQEDIVRKLTWFKAWFEVAYEYSNLQELCIFLVLQIFFIEIDTT